MKFQMQLRAAAMAAALTALAAAAQAQIKIGMMIPATGPLAQYGTMVKEGVGTAIEQVNAAGGINGQQVEAVVYDDLCDPKRAPAAANRVLDDKVRYVVGPVCSGAAISAAPMFSSQHVVMVTPSATSPSLTDGTAYHSIFRTIGTDNDQGETAARFIIEKIKPHKVAVLHDKQAYGRNIANTVRKALFQGNVKVELFEGLTSGEKDFSDVVAKLKAAGIDFVYFGGYQNDMGVLLRQSREQGVMAKMMGPDGVANAEINKIAGPAAEGMLVTLPADFSKDPKNAAIVKAFTDKKRDPAGAFQLTAYAATQVIMDSIKAVGNDPKLVANHMHDNAFQTPIGRTSWKPNGDLRAFQFQIFEWHKDGSKTLVN